MSLLDEALKKRQKESELPSHLLSFSESKESRFPRPRKVFVILLGGLLLVSAGISFFILKYGSGRINAQTAFLKDSEPAVASEQTPLQETHKVSEKSGESKSTETREIKGPMVIPEPGTKIVQTVHKATEGVIKKLGLNEVINKGETEDTEQSSKPGGEIARKETDSNVTKKTLHRAETKEKKSNGVVEDGPLPVTDFASKKVSTDNVTSFFLTGARYQRDGRTREAATIYNKILQRKPKYKKARINLAVAYIQLKRFDASRRILENLYHDYPNNPTILLNLAIVKTEFKEYSSALHLLNLAEKANGPQFQILLNKGIIFRKMGRIGDALRIYEAAGVLQPQNPKLLFNQAIAFDAARNYQRAISSYSAFLDSSHTDHSKDKQVERRLQQLYSYLSSLNREKLHTHKSMAGAHAP